jgi:hypothetical protein
VACDRVTSHRPPPHPLAWCSRCRRCGREVCPRARSRCRPTAPPPTPHLGWGSCAAPSRRLALRRRSGSPAAPAPWRQSREPWCSFSAPDIIMGPPPHRRREKASNERRVGRRRHSTQAMRGRARTVGAEVRRCILPCWGAEDCATLCSAASASPSSDSPPSSVTQRREPSTSALRRRRGTSGAGASNPGCCSGCCSGCCWLPPMRLICGFRAFPGSPTAAAWPCSWWSDDTDETSDACERRRSVVTARPSAVSSPAAPELARACSRAIMARIEWPWSAATAPLLAPQPIRGKRCSAGRSSRQQAQQPAAPAGPAGNRLMACLICIPSGFLRKIGALFQSCDCFAPVD